MSFGALYPDGAPRSEGETFASRAGHVTGWHFDFMENFTLQLSGTKTWRLKRSAVDVPLRGCTPMWGKGSHAVRTAADEDCAALLKLIKGIPSKLNLIPFNPWPGSPYACSSDDRIEAFAAHLRRAAPGGG